MTNLRPRKLPTPRQRADGQWEVRWRYTTPLGVEHRPQELFPTRADANAWILSNLADPSNLDRKAARLTFEFYAEKYLNAISGDVKVTTLNRERGAISHAGAYFAGRAVADIRPSDCREFRAALQAGGCTPHRRKITRAASVKHVSDVPRGAGPRRGGQRAQYQPRRDREPQGEPQDHPTGEVHAGIPLRRACGGAGGNPYGARQTALRPHGAVHGLHGAAGGRGVRAQRADIHLRQAKSSGDWRGYVDVHRTRRKEHGAWVEDTPKSEKSTRRVNLPGWLAGDLHAYLTERNDDPTAPLFPGRRPGGGVTRGPRKGEQRFRLNRCEPVEMGS
jgi:integrase-like protein